MYQLVQCEFIEELQQRLQDELQLFPGVVVGITPTPNAAEQVLIRDDGGFFTVEDWGGGGSDWGKDYPCTLTHDWTVRMYVALLIRGRSEAEIRRRCQEIAVAVLNATIPEFTCGVTVRPEGGSGIDTFPSPDGDGFLAEARIDVACHADLATSTRP